MKKLYRSRRDRFISGVCGGLGHYFGVDPTLVRLATVVILLATGCFPVLAGYALAWAIIPEDDGTIDVEGKVE